MQRLLAILALAVAVVAPAAAHGKGMVVARDEKSSAPVLSIRVSAGGRDLRVLSGDALVGLVSPIEVSTEEDSDQFDLRIQASSTGVQLKVEQRFETSLVIEDEGPRLALLDWKHFASGWVDVPRAKDGVYRSLAIGRADSMRFPDVTMASVLEEVRRRNPRWVPIAEKARTIRDYPIRVVVSQVTFRISARVDGKWSVVQVVHLRLPMGC